MCGAGVTSGREGSVTSGFAMLRLSAGERSGLGEISLGRVCGVAVRVAFWIYCILATSVVGLRCCKNDILEN
jgi:hypothetical protein